VPVRSRRHSASRNGVHRGRPAVGRHHPGGAGVRGAG
jgi:hypothetical protein